jgi:hypothetical protein
MHVKYKQDNFSSYDMIHQYVRDNSYGLTIHINFMVKCVCYTGIGFNGGFVADIALTGGHYRMDIISRVGHPRSDSVVPLVLCTVAYNIRGTDVVLQVPWDSANPVGNG